MSRALARGIKEAKNVSISPSSLSSAQAGGGSNAPTHMRHAEPDFPFLFPSLIAKERTNELNPFSASALPLVCSPFLPASCPIFLVNRHLFPIPTERKRADKSIGDFLLLPLPAAAAHSFCYGKVCLLCCNWPSSLKLVLLLEAKKPSAKSLNFASSSSREATPRERRRRTNTPVICRQKRS